MMSWCSVSALGSTKMFARSGGVVGFASVTLLLSACTDTPAGSSGFSATDSAGIRIVESASPAWSEAERWTVASAPAVDIGGIDNQYLDQPRDAVRFPDGKIFVTDDGYHVVRVFDADGQFVRTVGRVGEGPGEFGWIWAIDRVGDDAIMVHDYQQLRASVFDTAGTFRRSIRVVPGPSYWTYGLFQDNLILLRTQIASSRDRAVPGVYWDSVWMLLYRADTEPIDTLGRFPMGENVGQTGSPARQRYFGKYSQFTVGPDAIYWGSGRTYEIALLDPSGLRGLVRRRYEPVPSTAELIDSFKTAYMSAVRAQSRYHNSEADFANAERRLEEAEYAETLPAYSSLVVDQSGNLWAKNYRPPYVAGGAWSVFDPAGRWLGEVVMPGALEVLEIGHDYVLGIATDEQGLAFVRVHELSRPER